MNKMSLEIAGLFFLLVIRSAALCVLIPAGSIAWLAAFPWLHKARIGPGLLLGWLDMNFMVLVVRTVLRLFVVASLPRWVPWSQILTVKHRIGRLDE